jgi:cytochrome P450
VRERRRRDAQGDAELFDAAHAGSHLAFGVGTHYCIGSALARIEDRLALDEILDRFPEWDVDLTRARMSTVRGWESMPAVIG